MNTIVYSENEGGVSRAPEFDKQITVTLNQRDYVEVLRLKDTLSNAEFDEEKSNSITTEDVMKYLVLQMLENIDNGGHYDIIPSDECDSEIDERMLEDFYTKSRR